MLLYEAQVCAESAACGAQVREQKPMRTTLQLAAAIGPLGRSRDTAQRRSRAKQIHPATRVFQVCPSLNQYTCITYMPCKQHMPMPSRRLRNEAYLAALIVMSADLIKG